MKVEAKTQCKNPSGSITTTTFTQFIYLFRLFSSIYFAFVFSIFVYLLLLFPIRAAYCLSICTMNAPWFSCDRVTFFALFDGTSASGVDEWIYRANGDMENVASPSLAFSSSNWWFSFNVTMLVFYFHRKVDVLTAARMLNCEKLERESLLRFKIIMQLNCANRIEQYFIH